MIEFKSERAKRLIIYQKLLYAFSIIIIMAQYILKPNNENGYINVLFCSVVLFFITDTVTYKLDYFESETFYAVIKYIEAFVYEILLTFFTKNAYMYALLVMLSIITICEIIINDYDMDRYTVTLKRILCLAPLFIMSAICLAIFDEYTFIMLVLTIIIVYLISFYITEWFIFIENKYESKISNLTIEISDIETNNQKLRDYQEKVKTINEQINFQRIELSETNKNLEQANIEIAAQTDIMKYLASSFDIHKCLNVISESVIDVKKAKLCAIFVNKDVYLNKDSTCIIKTNYTSMHRRLKKDIEAIYNAIVTEKLDSIIFCGDEVREFRFVGDTNISALAFLPIMEKKQIYGVIIVGSDKEDFFKDGLNYYEDCIAKFNVAIKSTRMYLKMEEMAKKDGLTGIYNRIYFGELFKNAISKIKKNKKCISVALFDIDKFKSINDTYGHLAGDEVIKMVARVGEKYAEENGGFACRYGGEEFLVVVPDCDENRFLGILEKMHNEIKSTVVKYEKNEININVCIGFSTYPTICDDTDMLINRADNAMYYGKRNGRGRLVMDTPELEILEK